MLLVYKVFFDTAAKYSSLFTFWTESEIKRVENYIKYIFENIFKKKNENSFT